MLTASHGPLVTAVGLAGLLVAEANGSKRGVWVFKPLASAGFLLTASPGLNNPWGTTIFSSLVLSFIGDVLLIPDSPQSFQAGLFSFLLGHVGFAYAFAQRGLNSTTFVAAAAGNALLAGGVWKWLAPSLPSADRVPVALYVGVISAMVTTAIGSAGSWPEPTNWVQIAGAVLFQLSDLCVARNQFVERSYSNSLIGLPMYYVAQQLIARLTWA